MKEWRVVVQIVLSFPMSLNCRMSKATSHVIKIRDVPARQKKRPLRWILLRQRTWTIFRQGRAAIQARTYSLERQY